MSMSRLTQNQVESLQDLLERGKITAAQANVEKVRMARVSVVAKLPSDVRAALNEAVREGMLCHKRKDGLKPEVYYHPNFEHLAKAERNQAERAALRAIAKVAGGGL